MGCGSTTGNAPRERLPVKAPRARMRGPMPDRARISSRQDLTFKHNVGLGRHGWLRLTPAYSVRVVEQILASEAPRVGVLDPYSGTGTTALCASERGLVVQATDINPFLVWLGRHKVASYSDAVRRRALDAAVHVVQGVLVEKFEPVEAPPLYNIERWWPREILAALCALKGGVGAGTVARSKARPLLELAFCRTMMAVSSAAFDHQSMSFKAASSTPPQSAKVARQQVLNRFSEDVESVVAAAAHNPTGSALLTLGDARTLESIAEHSFDVVITSPPYPNRMSYIRELRPYMYWLNHLSEARQAGELDWRAIGGTWGVATSRLASWEPPAESRPMPTPLLKSLRAIRATQGQSAEVLARYVHKYFMDVRTHLAAMASRLAPGGTVHYVVGNSCFYGQLVATERIYAQLLRELGFERVEFKVLRKRNSKRELYEFDVIGHKPRPSS